MRKQNSKKLHTGSFIGRYEIDSKVGEGTSGVVYRVYDPLLDRDSAIKLARTDTLGEEETAHVLAEFRHEAKIAGKFAHENIVTIYDVVSDEHIDYLVMEFVPGRSLDDYLSATGPLEIDEALVVAYKTCVGLAYIHYNGVIHRDIKPANIMYHPAHGTVKLMDFSVAHNIEDQPSRDLGTIAYMAPEHFDPARRISHLTDIFALGSTLYRLLTGKYPFSREHTAFQILHQDPAPMQNHRAGIPDEFGQLVQCAMAKADEDRFQSAVEFAHALEDIAKIVSPQDRVIDTTASYFAA